MSERRYTAVFTISLLIAAAATYGVYRVLKAAEQGNQVDSRPVVVALRNLPQGVTIERAAVGTRNVPIQAIPAGAYSRTDSVIGRVTRVAVFEGEAIVPGRLAPVGASAGIEARIAPGKRGVGVRINDVAGMSGLIQPNSRVDVLVTLRDGAGRDQMAKIFLTNVRVLSMGAETERMEEGRAIRASTATLELTPVEAEQIALAQRQGTIQLVLRGYGDGDSVDTEGTRVPDMLGQLREAVPPPTPRPAPRTTRPRPRVAPDTTPPTRIAPPPPPEPAVVKVFRGEKVTDQKFDTTKGPPF
ncbi:MAG: Flp pilus assembly protein CpaB [Gemmatimonadaceae bacterium]